MMDQPDSLVRPAAMYRGATGASAVVTPSREAYDVVVVGGGLAGCAMGTLLARTGRNVLVLERKRYPVHKLCGEFLSPEAQGVFAELGVLDQVKAAGAVPIHRAALTAPSGARMDTDLPGQALGLSRYLLDPILFGAVRQAGGEALDGVPVRSVEREGDQHVVSWNGGSIRADAVVGAWGKRSNVDGAMERAFVGRTSPLVGFKAHFEGDDVGDWIELHAFDGGYCGMSHVENGRVNVCWISDERALKAAGGSPDAMLDGPMRANPHLAGRLDKMERVVPRFEAVAQVSFRRKGMFEQGTMMVGDTAAMITPFCGDGMAMALHSATVAAPLLAAHLDGDLSQADLETAYTSDWNRRYALRLRLGRGLHEAFSRPWGANALVRLGNALPNVARWVAVHTRG